MKQNTKYRPRKLLIPLIILLLSGGLLIQGAQAQVPPPPPPAGGAHNGHQLGGNQGAPVAPLGSGLEILLGLGILYSMKKLFLDKESVIKEVKMKA